MSRKPMEVEAFEQLDVIPVEGLPVEGEIEVVRQVGADVFARGHGIERVPQLVRMDVDGNVSATKELETAPVVEVEVREHDCFDVAEAVAGRADYGVQSVLVSVVRYCEELEDQRRPKFPGVGRSSCVVQNGTDPGMVDEGADDGDLAAGRSRTRFGQRADSGTGQRETLVVFDIAKVQRVQLHGRASSPDLWVASYAMGWPAGWDCCGAPPSPASPGTPPTWRGRVGGPSSGFAGYSPDLAGGELAAECRQRPAVQPHRQPQSQDCTDRQQAEEQPRPRDATATVFRFSNEVQPLPELRVPGHRAPVGMAVAADHAARKRDLDRHGKAIGDPPRGCGVRRRRCSAQAGRIHGP